MELSQALRQARHRILGTCNSVDAVVDAMGLDMDPDDLEDMLLDLNVERCAGCSWWFESFELNDDGYCNDCMPEEEED